MLCQIVSGGQGFDIKVKSLNLIIKDERYLIDNTNYGSPCIGMEPGFLNDAKMREGAKY